jgi:hypothetical protein
MAAFLWRMAGSPTGAPPAGFADVPAGQFYAPAVDWLMARGATGTTPTTYSPAASVTRAEVVTFLYRMAHNAIS